VIHLRVDNENMNINRRFACGIGPELPPGDKYFFAGEIAADRHVDCPGCNPGGPRKLGTPLSEVTPERLAEIARSWGYP
jgi:hypothetical protein